MLLKRPYGFIPLISVLLIFSFVYYFFSDDAKAYYDLHYGKEHQKIQAYIKEVNWIDKDSSDTIESIRNKLYVTPIDKYSVNIENAKNDVQNLIDQANRLSAPKGFQRHKGLFIKDLNQRMVVLSNYVKVSNTFPYQIQDSFTGMDVLSQLKDAETKELLKDLEKAGFVPKQLSDGSIKYK
ncbi:MAG: hypothetical protein Q8935_14870 [Bacillota bacterium]|nr:hypothetical protein [Bacillota bacterium]